MTHNEWLKGLKSGDKVAVERRRISGVTVYTIETAEKVMRGKVTVGTKRFYAIDGGEMTTGMGIWHRSRIVEPTEEILTEIKRREAIDLIQNMTVTELEKVPYADLLVIERILLAATAIRAG